MDESTLNAADRRLARNLRAARERAGLSQKEVAGQMNEKFGYSWRQQTVTRIEAAERAVKYTEAEDLARVLGLFHVGELGRPKGLLTEAWRIVDAAARARESRAAAKSYQADARYLREQIQKAVDAGNAGELEAEIAVARRALREEDA